MKKLRYSLALPILCLALGVLFAACGSVTPNKPGEEEEDAFKPGDRPDGGGYGSGSGGMNMPEMCEESRRKCEQEFVYKGSQTLPLSGGEESVELRADFLDSWGRGIPLSFDGTAWRGKAEVPWQMRILYKFKIIYKDKTRKDDWVSDPGNPESVDDGFGGKNSVLQGVTCAKWKCGPPISMCGGPPVAGAYDWRDAVLYFVFVDRFNDGGPPGHSPPAPGVEKPANWQGGNWKGVTDKINAGYFNQLGVNTLWLSVPMDNTDSVGIGDDNVHKYTAYHGYWPVDLDKPESRLGSETDLKNLITAAHGKGIKILIDYAMNHVHADAPIWKMHMNDGWFNSLDYMGGKCICGTGTCPWDGPTAERCWFRDYLPDFNFGNTAARNYSVSNAIKWVKDYNIDGLRLDAVKHIDIRWLTDLRDRLNKEIEPTRKEHIYLVGETFTGDMGLLRKYIDPCKMLDGQFDFPFRANLIRTILMRQGRMNDLESFLKMNDTAYGSAVMSTFVGNHDVVRSIHYAEDTKPGWIDNEWSDRGKDEAWRSPPGQPGGLSAYERLGVATALIYTNPGVPLLYYGDEVGMAGAGDPDNRRFMQWSGYNAGQDKLLSLTKKLGEIRAKYKALRKGTRRTLSVNANAWLYEMADGADKVYVAVNRGDGPETMSGLPGAALKDQLSGEMVSGMSVTVPARGVRILAP